MLWVKVLPTELVEHGPAVTVLLCADNAHQGQWKGEVKTMLSMEIVHRRDATVRGDWPPGGQQLTATQAKTFRGYRSCEVVKKRWVVE